MGGEVLSKRDRKYVKKYTKEMTLGQEALILNRLDKGLQKSHFKKSLGAVQQQYTHNYTQNKAPAVCCPGRCLTGLLTLALTMYKLCLLFTNEYKFGWLHNRFQKKACCGISSF